MICCGHERNTNYCPDCGKKLVLGALSLDLFPDPDFRPIDVYWSGLVMKTVRVGNPMCCGRKRDSKFCSECGRLCEHS